MTPSDIMGLVYLCIVFASIILWFVSLLSLRMKVMDDISRVMWAIFVTFAPLVGSLAYFMVSPGQSNDKRGGPPPHERGGRYPAHRQH